MIKALFVVGKMIGKDLLGFFPSRGGLAWMSALAALAAAIKK